MNHINLNDHHPILDIQNHVAFANNGNLVLCYRVELPEMYALSEKEFEDIHSTWFRAFKTLPTGTVIHKQDHYRQQGYGAENLPRSTFLQQATHNHFKGRQQLVHTSYLFFILPLDQSIKASRYINPFRSVEKGYHRKLDLEVAKFIGSVDDTVSYLNNSRWVDLYPMEAGDILEHTRDYFNGYNIGFDTNMLLGNRTIEIGDHYFDAMAINNELCFGESMGSSRPDGTLSTEDFAFHMGFLDGLGLKLSENHIVNQIMLLDDTRRWRKILYKKMEELSKSSNFGNQNRSFLKKVRDIAERIEGDDSSRIVRGHLNLVFWHHDKTGLQQVAGKIKAEFKELDMHPYHPNGEERKHYFLNSHPCHATNFSNEDLYVADMKQALCCYINTTNYRSDPTGIIFNDRLGNLPVIKDVWDAQKKRIKARNFAILAPTGEGKSFLANNIIRQFFEQGVHLVIIDLGGSYTKLAQLYPKEHMILRYRYGKHLGINPFHIPSEAGLTPEVLEDLALFILELLGEEPDMKSREVAMKKVLLHYYKHVRKRHSLGSLYNFVDEHKDRLARDVKVRETDFSVYHFLHILSEYVGDGPYSFLFNGQDDQTHRLEDKRLIIFELDEVRDNKEILSVMLKLIKSAIQRSIWRNRKQRGVILFDEFAKQLKFPHVLDSVEYYYQAIRKQNGAIGIILQSINQLPDNSTAASILENTQVVYCLRNEKGYGTLARRLNLGEHELNQLRSIRNKLTGDRKYTEMFIKIGRQSNVFRLEVPPEVEAAFLTDGPENQQLMELFERTGDMQRAIQDFITLKNKQQ